VVRRNEDGEGEILSNVVLSQWPSTRRSRRGAGDRGARPCRALDHIIERALAEAKVVGLHASTRRGGGRAGPDRGVSSA